MPSLGRFVPQSPEWFEARRWRVGASEAAVVLGLSPYQGAADLMAAKLSGAIREETSAMRRGRLLEPAILAWGAEVHGLDYDGQASVQTYVHDELPWALANPDAVTRDGIYVEAKTTHDRTREDGWGRGGTDAVPLAYQIQCEWVCAVLGLDRWTLIVLAGGLNGRPGLDFMAYRGYANPIRFTRMAAHIGRWHDRLITERDRSAA